MQIKLRRITYYATLLILAQAQTINCDRAPILGLPVLPTEPVPPGCDLTLVIGGLKALKKQACELLEEVTSQVITETIDQIEAQLGSGESKLCDIQTRVEDISSRLPDIVADSVDIQTRTEDIDTKVDHIESRLQSTLIFQSDIDNAPFIISEPGFYCLAEDVFVATDTTAISIEASNVIFDLNQHLIAGSGGSTPNRSGVAITKPGLRNITVKNGMIAGGDIGATTARLNNCVRITTTCCNVQLRDLALQDAEDTCLECCSARNLIVDRCLITDAGAVDASITAGERTLLRDCVFELAPIQLVIENSLHTNVINCTFINTAGATTSVNLCDSSFSVFRGCTLINVGDIRFQGLVGSQSGIVESCTGNGGVSNMVLTTGSVENLGGGVTIHRCNVSQKVGNGFILSGALRPDQVIRCAVTRCAQDTVVRGAPSVAGSVTITRSVCSDAFVRGIDTTGVFLPGFICGNHTFDNPSTGIVALVTDVVWLNVSSGNFPNYSAAVLAALRVAPTDTTFAIAGNIDG